MPESCKIICLGDIILDTYCDGLVERISPEAPIPILKVENDKIYKDAASFGILNISVYCPTNAVGAR